MTTPTTTAAPRMTREEYAQAAREYCASLPLEHFMESTRQSTQSNIAYTAGTDLKLRGANLSRLHDLLIQYFFEGNLRRVVPDIFLVIGDAGEQNRESWDAELEELLIFLVMEFVSRSNARKDYVDSYQKNVLELKVPYYLIVDHERNVLRLQHLEGGQYVVVEANAAGRLAVPELELEIGWKDGWARFWHRGELLPLTQEQRAQMDALREQLREKDELLVRKDEQLSKMDGRISELAATIELLSAGEQKLRAKVEARARKAGRQDILDGLPSAVMGRLTDLLDELS